MYTQGLLLADLSRCWRSKSNDRFGSKAIVSWFLKFVCYAGQSGHDAVKGPLAAWKRTSNATALNSGCSHKQISTDADPHGQELVSTFPEASSSATIWRLWERKKGGLSILAEKEIDGNNVRAQLQEKVGT